MEDFLSDGVGISYLDFEPLTADRHEPIVLIHGFASTHAVNWLFTQWVKTLTEDGRRVVLFDNRGHGRSEKLYDPAAYSYDAMAGDVARLMDHLSIERADIMGYSMGARIATYFALANPQRARSLLLGGVGVSLIERDAMAPGMAEAMEIERIEDIDDPGLKIFRGFAESTRSPFEDHGSDPGLRRHARRRGGRPASARAAHPERADRRHSRARPQPRRRRSDLQTGRAGISGGAPLIELAADAAAHAPSGRERSARRGTKWPARNQPRVPRWIRCFSACAARPRRRCGASPILAA
jgi:pimeloyl-ACP methyl ester carboxylesterase